MVDPRFEVEKKVKERTIEDEDGSEVFFCGADEHDGGGRDSGEVRDRRRRI